MAEQYLAWILIHTTIGIIVLILQAQHLAGQRLAMQLIVLNFIIYEQQMEQLVLLLIEHQTHELFISMVMEQLAVR
jgi:hypothetical protein